MSVFAVAPAISALIALRQTGELENTPSKLKLATAAVTGAGGSFVFVFISYIFAILTLETGGSSSFLPEIGDAFLPMFLIAIGGAVTAAGVVWVIDNLGTPQAGTPGQPR